MWSIVSYPDKLWYNSQFKIKIAGATPEFTQVTPASSRPTKSYKVTDLTYPDGEWDEAFYLYSANSKSGPLTLSDYTIFWVVRYPNPNNREGEQREYGPRQFEVFGDGVGPGSTSQTITVTVFPDPEVFFPSDVLFNTEFSIEVSGAIPGEQYSIEDFSVSFSNRVLASGIAPSSSFTIFCSPLKSFTGPHEIRATFYSQPTEQLSPINAYDQEIAEPFVKTFYINVTTDTWNAVSSNRGKFFESNKRYQYGIGRSGVEVDFRLPLPQTITANIGDMPFSTFPTEAVLSIGTRVTFRDSSNGNRFFSGTISSRTVFSSFSVDITVNVDQVRNLKGEVTSGNGWFVDQDPVIAGETGLLAVPVFIQDELGPTTRNDLTYTQVDLGQGLLPSYLSLDPATGYISGTIPSNEKMAGYTIGIEVTNGFKTEVVAWDFGGIVGAVEIDPGVFTDLGDKVLRFPIRSSLPNGVIRVTNVGQVPPNNAQYVWADGKDFLDENGDGVIEVGFLSNPRGRYRLSYRLYAIDGPLDGPDAVYGKSFLFDWTAPITSGGVITWEGVFVEDRNTYKVPSSVPIVVTTVTNSITLRLGQPITPTAIITASGGEDTLRYVLGPIGDGFYPGGYLPDGLSFDTSTGILSGTPTSLYGKTNAPGLGGDTFWVNVTDGIKDANEVGATFFTIGGFVNNLVAITALTTTTVIVDILVSLTPVIANNAIGATTFSIAPSLPSGLSFSTSTGQITGSASITSLLTTYSVTVEDLTGSTSVATFDLKVEAPNLTTTLNISSRTFSSGVGITPFTPVTHTGGYGTVSYSVTPSLPANLILNTTNGQIAGVPISVQSTRFYTIRVRDEASQISTQTFSLTITSSLSANVATSELAFARGNAILPVIPVTGVGGVTPYLYSVSPSLPSGLSLNTANGEISGTPTISSTTTNHTITVTDSNLRTATGVFSLRIEPLVVEASLSTVIRADDYNDIKLLTEEILGTGITGYGYTGIKSLALATAGSIIGWKEWSDLKDDVNLITAHQTANYFNYTTSTSVTANFVNQLVDNLNEAEQNRYLLPPQNNTGTTSSVWTSAYSAEWGTSINSTATLIWPAGLSINYFFNLGGRITFELDYLPSTASAGNTGWQTFIDNSQSFIDDFIFDVNGLSSGFISTSTDSATGKISLSALAVDNNLTCSIELENSLLDPVDLQVRGTVLYTYSDSVLKAPLPAEIDLKEFNTGTFIPVILPTKILKLTATPNTYSWALPNSSITRTITLENIGNQPVDVSNITFVDNANVDRIVNGTINGNIGSITVDVANTYTFTLAYTGIVVGNFESSFTVNSNNDAGPITAATLQIVSDQPFDFTISPPSVSINYNSPSLWSQSFVINANRSFEDYSASFTSGGSNFILDDTPTSGPTVRFNPIGKLSGTYPAVLSITVNGVTKTASISIVLTAIPSINLGSWLSPQTSNFSVIGMSYDLIANERYLTIGIANLAPPFISLNDLGLDADDGYKNGLQTFPAQTDSKWSTFLRNFGVWPAPTQEIPVNINVGRTATYRFEAPVTGIYTYEYSSDDDSNFAIDYVSLPNQLMTGGNSGNWRNSYFGSISLTAGTHILTYYHINYRGPAGAAFQIKDPSGNVIWNTRYPVRSGQVYGFWNEVYRFKIPADGTQQELFSSQWCIKDTFVVDQTYHWGRFFAGDMFKIIDDGFGNLDIEFFGSPRSVPGNITNASTFNNIIRFMPYLFYYYLPDSFYSSSGAASVTRLTNLDTGPAGDGTQTRYFFGFNQDGAVRTVLRNIPTAAPSLLPFNPGGGGGGAFDEFTNQQEK